MKRFVSIGLILIMSLQCFCKLGVIAYFQLNRQYISEVFCINKEKPMTMCYGECFLQKNLGLVDDTSGQDNSSTGGKEKFEMPVFLISENEYSFTHVLHLNSKNARYFFNSSSEHVQIPFHPPAA